MGLPGSETALEELVTRVLGLRSYIGAFKDLATVIKDYSQILSPLETFAAGKSSSNNIVWSEELRAALMREI